MEIERKWMVKGWPEGLSLREEFAMRQGYISVRPTVRIRKEALTGGETKYILCFKSGSAWLFGRNDCDAIGSSQMDSAFSSNTPDCNDFSSDNQHLCIVYIFTG